MKVINHGRYYINKLNIICNKCDCKYEITKKDIQQYEKPIKITFWGFDDCWKEKRCHYTKCPECWFENPLEPRDYDTLINEIKGSDNYGHSNK